MEQEIVLKMNNLFSLLDNLDCIKELERFKNNYSDDLLDLINKYHNIPTIENKKNLFTNNEYLNYLKNENELNYLIMEINKKFKEGRDNCEGN